MSVDSENTMDSGWKSALRTRQLSARQLYRVKFASAAVTAITAFSMIATAVVEATDYKYTYGGVDYMKKEHEIFSRGKLTYFTNNEEFCTSFILTPGWNLQNRYLNAVLYILCLIFIFIGVSIISDKFMDSITVITSAKRVARLQDENGNILSKEVDVWNSTVANLTLMALGSSAPEIMLNVIEMVMTLGDKPGELGPSTIVGSAAFNLLVISGVSIAAVSEKNDERDEQEIEEDGTPLGVKKIEKVPVFILTTIFSLVAYVWMYIVLEDEKVYPYEAWITFGLFVVLIASAYGIDVCVAKSKVKPAADEALPVINTKEFIQILQEADAVPEEKMEPGQLNRVKTLKKHLSEKFNTEDYNQVNYAELKESIEGEQSKSRAKYRKGFMAALSGKKPKINKGEKFKREENLARNIAESRKNDHFGFATLSYTVSEACKFVEIIVLNKTTQACSVGVRTRENSAKYGVDFMQLDQTIEFKSGQEQTIVKVEVIDDDEWAEDRDFTVELYNVITQEAYREIDTITSVLIIDDDKPGHFNFTQKKGQIRHVASQEKCEVEVSRTSGADGTVKCKWKTFALKHNTRAAEPETHFKIQEGTLTLPHAVTKGTITVDILCTEDPESANQLLFGIKLTDPEPRVVKIKRDTLIVELVTDYKAKKQADALQEWLDKMEDDEKLTWGQQIKKSVMLHPTIDEDGNIEDVECGDAIFHLLSIFWKVVFSFNPPDHYGGGWPSFFGSLFWIGAVTVVVAEIANLMGCVLGILPGVTAITFVAIGTSIPDTFASKIAAQQERYADESVGNVTGSNSVNVFLGLGLPWIIATVYGQVTGTTYEQKSPGLAQSVLMFLVVSLIGIMILVIRRFVYKGELGGPRVGRYLSCAAFILLWFVYVTIATLGSYGMLFSTETKTVQGA